MKIIAEVGDVRAATDEVNRSKASAEKSYRNLLNTLNDLNKKVEEANLHLGDLEAFRRRLTAENADVLRQLQEQQNNASLLTKTRAGLVSSLDEAKGLADHEAKRQNRQQLQSKSSNFGGDFRPLSFTSRYWNVVDYPHKFPW